MQNAIKTIFPNKKSGSFCFDLRRTSADICVHHCPSLIENWCCCYAHKSTGICSRCCLPSRTCSSHIYVHFFLLLLLHFSFVAFFCCSSCIHHIQSTIVIRIITVYIFQAMADNGKWLPNAVIYIYINIHTCPYVFNFKYTHHYTCDMMIRCICVY